MMPLSSTMQRDSDLLTGKIIGCAIEVHRRLGPGLLESLYERAMAVELALRGIPFSQQSMIPVSYKGQVIGEHRLDLIVANQVVVELKAVERSDPLFEAQLLGYLRASGCRLGLLINFNTRLLREGVKRLVVD